MDYKAELVRLEDKKAKCVWTIKELGNLKGTEVTVDHMLVVLEKINIRIDEVRLNMQFAKIC